MSKEEYRPKQSKQPEYHRPHLEAGNGALGIPPTLQERAKPPPESSAHRGSERTRVQQPQPESHERQPLPCVWDYLERKARRFDNLSRMTEEDSEREERELDRLKEEIDEKGTDRDKHILALLYIRRPRLSLLSEQQQIQQWRSRVEPLSNEEIAGCARRQKQEIEAFRSGEIPIQSLHPSVGDGEIILADFIEKRKQEQSV